ncbi:MAG: cupin domain-containing protein [Acidimicrobiia bacterium]|nr:cupin domain-containing protein [Acidimicrobiia bacterium]
MEADEVTAHLGLEPLPVEGGWFRQVWRSPPDAERPAGTAIVAMFTDQPDGFSQFHRLDRDELWHAYLGDPLELILLEPGGTSRHVVLGPDLAAGHVPVQVVPAGTWMAARTTGRWSVTGATLAPGFTSDCYEGADVAELLADWPTEADAIRALTRPGSPRRLPPNG